MVKVARRKALVAKLRMQARAQLEYKKRGGDWRES